MDRRHFVAGSAATAAAFSIRPAFAEDIYPSHAITIINPFPPGGASDVVSRPLAAVLEPIVKQPVVIETKAGAAGAVGAQVAANAKPDGYTLLSHITSISGFAEVDKLFGRPVKFTRADFIPLARFVADPCVLIVNDQQPYKTLKDLTDDATKRPDQIIFSSSGLYGALHIPTALYMKAGTADHVRHHAGAVGAHLRAQAQGLARQAGRGGSRRDRDVVVRSYACALLRACSAMAISAAPPNTILMPTRSPIAQAAVLGRPPKIIAPSTRSTMPLTSIQPHLPVNSRL
jgi:hypothetical protein